MEGGTREGREGREGRERRDRNEGEVGMGEQHG